MGNLLNLIVMQMTRRWSKQEWLTHLIGCCCLRPVWKKSRIDIFTKDFEDETLDSMQCFCSLQIFIRFGFQMRWISAEHQSGGIIAEWKQTNVVTHHWDQSRVIFVWTSGPRGFFRWSPEIGSSVSAIEWVNCVLSCTECWGVYDKQGGTVENSN